jgi:hypothetical protein
VPEVFPLWRDFDTYIQALIKTGTIDAVIKLLMQQTMQGIPLEVPMRAVAK